MVVVVEDKGVEEGVEEWDGGHLGGNLHVGEEAQETRTTHKL